MSPKLRATRDEISDPGPNMNAMSGPGAVIKSPIKNRMVARIVAALHVKADPSAIIVLLPATILPAEPPSRRCIKILEMNKPRVIQLIT